MKKAFFILFILIIMFGTVSCAKKQQKAEDTTLDIISEENSTDIKVFDSDEANQAKAIPEYKKMNQSEAHEIMNEDPNAIILDVRTSQEFDEGHIPNAILIPDYEIAEKATEIILDKNALIFVYCRSGNRSKTATKALVALGYTNSYDIGGINSWEYEIEK